jgi:hypothetical protein
MPAYNYYPNYYNVPSWQPINSYPQQSFALPVNNQQFMIQVDGEIGAKAWQPQSALPPNTVIPLWDFDGIHVYFKSTDGYGRMNPIRKAKVIFEDEAQNLPSNVSGSEEHQNVSGAQSIEFPDMSKYVTKEDLESLKADLRSMFTAQAMSNQNHTSGNQNGNSSSNGRGNR